MFQISYYLDKMNKAKMVQLVDKRKLNLKNITRIIQFTNWYTFKNFYKFEHKKFSLDSYRNFPIKRFLKEKISFRRFFLTTLSKRGSVFVV